MEKLKNLTVLMGDDTSYHKLPEIIDLEGMQCQVKVKKTPNFMSFDGKDTFRISPQALYIKQSYTIQLTLTDKISSPVDYSFKVNLVSDSEFIAKDTNNTNSRVLMKIVEVTRD